MHKGFTEKIRVGPDRSFGLVFSVFFAILGLAPLTSGSAVRLWALGIAAAFLVVALTIPRILKPLNLVWFKIGMALHVVVTPVVMGVLFYAVVTPVGLLMRARGKAPMRLKCDPVAATYWIDRAPPGPEPESMKNQF